MPELPFPPIVHLELTDQLRFILDLGAAVAAALLGGVIAVRLRQPAVVGYLLAGVLIGPFTPGFTSDVHQIQVLAEIGVVLLLFALGVEFSIRDLAVVRTVALPGGAIQVGAITVVGTVVELGIGLDLRAALVVGGCLAISSTLVLVKALIERGELDSLHGRVAIGWSIVQDIATIVMIVALPALASGDAVGPLVLALGKAAAFLGLAYVFGTRLLPRGFAAIARLGSPELFLLAVFSTALLTAFVSSAVFGLSLALGAFVAGALLAESDLSHQAAAEVVPFRDLFAVLFFVSVGMLVDPAALVSQAGIVALLAVVAIAGKGGLTALLGRGFGLPLRSAILLGAGLAQVGEFSFILAQNGASLGVLDAAAYNLILGTAVVTIVASPFVGALADRLVRVVEGRADLAGTVAAPVAGDPPTSRSERSLESGDGDRRPVVVVLGAGRVGRLVVNAIRTRGFRVVVIDRDQRRLEEIRRAGAASLYGDAANPAILARAGLDRARVLVVAIGDPLTARLATERALRINPRLTISVRARGRDEIELLRTLGAGRVADPEAEAAFELARHALQRMGVSGPELTGIISGLRRDAYGR